MKNIKNILVMGTILLLAVSSFVTAAQGENKLLPVIRNDLKVDLKASMDLTNGNVTYDYSIKNIEKESTQLEIVNPNFAKTGRLVALSPQATKETRFSGRILPQSLSAKTMFATFRPYLLVGKTQEVGRLLLTDHDVDITIKLPQGARMLKCSLPYITQRGQLLTWKVKKLNAVPVIHVWYTTAAENVEIEQRITDKKDEVVVALNIINKSGMDIKDISIRTQFPRTLFEAVADQSTGEFELEQDIMYRWRVELKTLPRGAKRTVSYTLRKMQPGVKFKPSEIVVYNSTGDIISVK